MKGYNYRKHCNMLTHAEEAVLNILQLGCLCVLDNGFETYHYCLGSVLASSGCPGGNTVENYHQVNWK